MEFKISTDLTTIPQNIIFNFDELKTTLDTNLEHYRSLVVTEDAIKSAKSDRAKLNKLKTALEDKRKEIKNQCLEPYNAFESQIKQLTGMITEAMSAIDTQTKGFEDVEKQKKQEEIERFWLHNSKKLFDVIPFGRIFNPKWLNKTAALPDIMSEIMKTIEGINADLETIDSLESEYKLQMKDVYFSTLDLSKAIQENKRLTEMARKLEESKPEPKPAPEPPPPIPTTNTEPSSETVPAANTSASAVDFSNDSGVTPIHLTIYVLNFIPVL